jgi:hypothetical protein
MAEFWHGIYTRGLQTNGIWGPFAPGFTVGDVTLALHTTDVNLLPTRAAERDAQQDAVDVSRLNRNTNLSLMEDLCVRFPRLLEGLLAPEDPLHAEISDIRDIVPNTPEKTAARARRCVSLWTRINTLRAAAAPPLPALLVGTKAVADLQGALDSQGTLLQAIETERGKLSQKREALRQLAIKVDQNNKRWFAMWEGFYAAGSPEREALSQIDTGSPVPEPTALQIASLLASGPGEVSVTYTPGGGNHATTLTLLWQRVGVDADFSNNTPVVPAGQTITGLTAGQTVKFKTRASNSSGDTESAEQPIVVT